MALLYNRKIVHDGCSSLQGSSPGLKVIGGARSKKIKVLFFAIIRVPCSLPGIQPFINE